MYSAFVKLLNMSAASGVLIAAVIALRFLLRKVPKKYICILWALVALRLICPVSISSSLSVFNHVGTYHPDNGQISYIQYNEKTEKPMGEIPYFSRADSSPDGPTVEHRTSNFYLPTAMLIWAAGMAAMLLYAAVSYFRIHRRTGESIRFESNIYLCDRIPTPFILGMIRPRIFLPSDLTDGQIQSIIAHERAHISRLDHWWKPLGFLLLCIHWFNPLVWAAYGLLCRDIELACDEKVIQHMTASQKQEYSQVLLSCSLPRKFISACPLAFGEVGVKQRIRGIVNYRKPSIWVILIAVIACMAVGVGFLTNPERNGDYLIVKSQKTKPAKPQTADFKINMGNTIRTATVYAELWQNGVCVESTPLVLPETVKEIHLSMSRQMEGASLTGYQIQIGAKPGDVSLSKTIPLPEETYLLDCGSWSGPKDIQLTPEKKILLGSLIFDRGGGFFLFSFDNADYGECGDRLQNQDCVILVWASFQEAYPASTDWSVSIVPERVSRTGATAAFQCGDSAPGTLTYGESLSLERWENGAWMPVAELPGSGYSPGDASYPVVNDYGMVHEWQDRFGELPDGQYRMGKQVTLVSPEGGSETRMLYGEFSLPGSILTGPIPLAELPALYSGEQAMLDGCLVLEDGVLRDNGDAFRAFAADCDRGKPGFFRIVNWHYGENSHCTVHDLSFDGSRYTLSWLEDGELRSKTYRYLLHDAAYGSWERYCLTNDRSEASASPEDTTNYTVFSFFDSSPQKPAIPGPLVQATLEYREEPLVTVTDSERLWKLQSLFASAELLGYEPKTHSIGIGLNLILTAQSGETLTIELDPDDDLCRINGGYVFYGAYDQPSYVPRLWEYLGISRWPDGVPSQMESVS